MAVHMDVHRLTAMAADLCMDGRTAMLFRVPSIEGAYILDGDGLAGTSVARGSIDHGRRHSRHELHVSVGHIFTPF